MPSSVTKLQKQVPIQYQKKEQGSNYHLNKVAFGFGEKSDFMGVKRGGLTPGPDRYDTKNSISNNSMLKNPSSKNGFYNTHDKYDKICYKGME